MITQILSMVLPVLAMILLGRLCATKGILNDERHAGLKAIIGDILLPVVLFNAFFTAQYDGKLLLVFALVFSSCLIALIAGYALNKLEIDHLGLDNIDRRMLESIIKFYGGGPVGLETLAATIGEEAVTLEDMYEPYLMQIGFLNRTPRGRCVTKLAYDHLGLPYHPPKPSPADQLRMFDVEGKQ